MLLSEPQESPYDARFRLFGFSIRVTWLFWVVIAALGYDRSLSLQEDYSLRGYDTEFTVILLLWVAAGFLSILVHELGHSLAFRFFGIESHIVLYQMGGLRYRSWIDLGKARVQTEVITLESIDHLGGGTSDSVAVGIRRGSRSCFVGHLRLRIRSGGKLVWVFP